MEKKNGSVAALFYFLTAKIPIETIEQKYLVPKMERRDKWIRNFALVHCNSVEPKEKKRAGSSF